MKDFEQYWTFSAIRGALTIVAAGAIYMTPLTAASIFSVPQQIGLALACYVAYCIFDSAVGVFLAQMLPASSRGGRALYVRAALSLVMAVVLAQALRGALSSTAIFLIVAAQAGLAAIAEYLVARSTHRQYGCLSCYSTAMTMAAAALVLPFAGGLDAMGMTSVLAGFVSLYGGAQMMLAARMLFLEYRAEHPMIAASMEWKALMDQRPVQVRGR